MADAVVNVGGTARWQSGDVIQAHPEIVQCGNFGAVLAVNTSSSGNAWRLVFKGQDSTWRAGDLHGSDRGDLIPWLVGVDVDTWEFAAVLWDPGDQSEVKVRFGRVGDTSVVWDSESTDWSSADDLRTTGLIRYQPVGVWVRGRSPVIAWRLEIGPRPFFAGGTGFKVHEYRDGGLLWDELIPPVDRVQLGVTFPIPKVDSLELPSSDSSEDFQFVARRGTNGRLSTEFPDLEVLGRLRVYTDGGGLVVNSRLMSLLGLGPRSLPSPGSTVPGPVQGLNILTRSGGADLAWDAPSSNGGAPLTGYVVSWVSGSENGTEVISAMQTEFSITNLEALVEVTVTVQARNIVGLGATSTVSTVPVPEGAASGTIPNLETQNLYQRTYTDLGTDAAFSTPPCAACWNPTLGVCAVVLVGTQMRFSVSNGSEYRANLPPLPDGDSFLSAQTVILVSRDDGNVWCGVYIGNSSSGSTEISGYWSLWEGPGLGEWSDWTAMDTGLASAAAASQQAAGLRFDHQRRFMAASAVGGAVRIYDTQVDEAPTEPLLSAPSPGSHRLVDPLEFRWTFNDPGDSQSSFHLERRTDAGIRYYDPPNWVELADGTRTVTVPGTTITGRFTLDASTVTPISFTRLANRWWVLHQYISNRNRRYGVAAYSDDGELQEAEFIALGGSTHYNIVNDGSSLWVSTTGDRMQRVDFGGTVRETVQLTDPGSGDGYYLLHVDSRYLWYIEIDQTAIRRYRRSDGDVHVFPSISGMTDLTSVWGLGGSAVYAMTAVHRTMRGGVYTLDVPDDAYELEVPRGTTITATRLFSVSGAGFFSSFNAFGNNQGNVVAHDSFLWFLGGIPRQIAAKDLTGVNQPDTTTTPDTTVEVDVPGVPPKIAQTGQSYILPANWASNRDVHEYSVAVYDKAGNVSPESNRVSVTAGEISAATITSPSSGTVFRDLIPSVSWTTPGVQTQWGLRVYPQGSSVPISGMGDNPSDSFPLIRGSSEKSTELSTPGGVSLLDDGTYDVEVVWVDDIGLVSPPSGRRRFSVTLTPSVVATVMSRPEGFILDETDGTLEYTYGDPGDVSTGHKNGVYIALRLDGGAQPGQDGLNVWKREARKPETAYSISSGRADLREIGPRLSLVGIETPLESNYSMQALRNGDTTVKSGVQYEYRCDVTATNGKRSIGEWFSGEGGPPVGLDPLNVTWYVGFRLHVSWRLEAFLSGQREVQSYINIRGTEIRYQEVDGGAWSSPILSPPGSESLSVNVPTVYDVQARISYSEIAHGDWVGSTEVPR